MLEYFVSEYRDHLDRNGVSMFSAFMKLMQEGGWVMWPIVALSVVGLAVVLERLWRLSRFLLAREVNRVPSPQQHDVPHTPRHSVLAPLSSHPTGSPWAQRMGGAVSGSEAVAGPGRCVVHLTAEDTPR